MKHLKRGISLFAALALVISTVSSVFADWTDDALDLDNTSVLVSGTTEANMPEMKTSIVELDNATGKFKPSTKTSWAKDDTFIVAVEAINFDRFVGNAETGLRSVSTGLVYDADLLEPTVAGDKRPTFQGRVEQLFEADNSHFYNDYETYGYAGYYQPNGSNTSPAMSLESTETTELTGSNIKKASIPIEYVADTSDSGQYKMATISNHEYIGFYEFKVLEEATTPTPGIVLSRSRSLVVNMGLAGGPTMNKTFGNTDGLHRYMKLTDGVDLWPAPYVVTYDANGGKYDGDVTTMTESVPVTDSSSKATLADSTGKPFSELITTPKKDGEKDLNFAGWYISATDFSDANRFTTDTVITEDITVYARWEDGFTVSFDPNGGKFADDSTDVISVLKINGASVEDADIPADPTREFNGSTYDFKGWTITANGMKADGTPETLLKTNADIKGYSFNNTNTTFYAQWEVADDVDEADKVTVKFHPNDGTTPEPKPEDLPSVTIVKGDKVGGAMPTVPTKADYEFDYWSKNQNGADKATAEFTANTPVDADITVYAQWKMPEDANPDDYATVTFTKGTGTTEPDPATKTVKKNEAIGENNMPTPPTSPVASEVFDQWKVTVSADAAIIVGSFLTGATKINGNVTVEPTFKNAVPVTFYPNSGQFTGDNAGKNEVVVSSLGANDAIPASVQPTVTREGYQFFYWNTQPDGFGDTVNADYKIPATPPADGVKLYAIWNAATPDPTDPENPPTTDETTGITVTFNGNGGTPATADRYLNVNDTKLEALMSAMPVATRDKYKNIGWNTTAGGTGDSVAIDTDLTTLSTYNSTNKTITLYAQWEADPEDPDVNEEDIIDVEVYKNKSDMDAGDNTKAIATYKVVSGDKLTALDTPVVDGMTFAGWKKGADDSAFDIAADTITVTGDPKVYKIYATWTASVNIVVEEFETTYNGEVQGIKVTKVVLATDDTKDLTASVGTPIITYTQGADTTPVQPQDAGDYTFAVSFADTGITVGGYIYSKTDASAAPTFKIKRAKLSVTKKTGENVAGKEQSYKISETEAEGYIGFVPEVTATLVKNDKTEVPVNLVKDTDFTVQYSDKFTNDSDWNAAERAFVTTVPKGNDAIGKYTVKIVLGTEIAKNYEIDTVGQYINTYYAADADPAPTGAQKAEAIKFDVTPDIELNGLAVKSGKGEDKTAYTTDAPTYGENTYENAKPFDPDKNDTYYVKVGVEEGLVLVIDGTLDPTKSTITVNGTPITLPEKETEGDNAGKYVVGPITNLTPADGNGASNTIVITPNTGEPDKTQTLDVVQLIAPKITLNYGNSPYGEIMRDAAITDKETAKDEFAKTYTYAAGYVPASGSTDVYYSPETWTGNDNLDLDDKALFAFIYRGFTDPGFTATDSMGKPVNLENVTRTIKVTQLNEQNAGAEKSECTAYTVNGTAEKDVFTNEQLTGDANALINPDIYELEYSFTDPMLDAAASNIKITRKVVILPTMGDTTLDGGISVGDLTPIKDVVAQKTGILEPSFGNSYYLLFGRVYDTTYDNGISVGDLSPVKDIVAQKTVKSYYSEYTK